MSGSTHPLEGDGTLINVYYYLWKKKVNTLSSGLNVKIPSTVVYEHNFPKGWYSWSDKKDEIERRVGKEIDTKAISNAFSKKPRGAMWSELDVVASYMSKVEDPDTGEEHSVVEFFDKDELHDFLTKRARRDAGILQRFIPPNGKHNLTIQAVWSPHVTLVEKRQNVYALTDKRYSIFERVVTYEGPTHFSRQAFVAPHIESQIKNICDRFTEHFYTTEHVNISRMVLYFKVDSNSDIWLLWSSSIRIQGKEKLNLAPRFQSPKKQTSEREGAGEEGEEDPDALPLISPQMGPIKDLYTSVPDWTERRRRQIIMSRTMDSNYTPRTPRTPNSDEQLTPRPPQSARVTGSAKEELIAPPKSARAPRTTEDGASPDSQTKLEAALAFAEEDIEDELFPMNVSFIKKYRNVEARYGGPVKPKKKKKQLDESASVTIAAPVEVEEKEEAVDAQPQRVRKSGAELWGMLRKAYEFKFFQTVGCCQDLSIWLDELMYSIYSHFLGTRTGMVFTMPPSLREHFGEKFYEKFKTLIGIKKMEEEGDYEMKRPPPSVVTLQNEVDDWLKAVTVPLLNLGHAITMVAINGQAGAAPATQEQSDEADAPAAVEA